MRKCHSNFCWNTKRTNNKVPTFYLHYFCTIMYLKPICQWLNQPVSLAITQSINQSISESNRWAIRTVNCTSSKLIETYPTHIPLMPISQPTGTTKVKKKYCQEAEAYNQLKNWMTQIWLHFCDCPSKTLSKSYLLWPFLCPAEIQGVLCLLQQMNQTFGHFQAYPKTVIDVHNLVIKVWSF